jgi:hypothetical protein
MDVPIFNMENIQFHCRRGYYHGSNQKIIVIIVNIGRAGMQGFLSRMVTMVSGGAGLSIPGKREPL